MKSSLVFLVCLVTTAAAQEIGNREACDNTSTLGPTEGNINSPNYPGLYYDFLNCSYYINASQESTFEFIFESLSTDRCCDYVTISCLSDPSFPPYKLSGYSVPGTKVWVSGCSQGFVNFLTDRAVVNTGFNLTYYVSIEDTTAFCGDTSHNGPSGVISSPNYPGNYYNDLVCDYYIYAATGSSISLIFKSFDVEDGYDYVTISCPDNTTFLPQIYTGNSIPEAVSIPWCSRGKVTFHTDYTTASSGFSLNYYISIGGCGNTVYTGSNGYVTTSNYPDEHGYNQNCSYIIWAPERSTFYLNSVSFYLDSGCDSNWLEVRCMDNSDYGPYKFCTIYTTAVDLYIYGCSQVLLWFHSDAFVYQEGFKIEYTVYPDAETTTVAGTPDFTQTTYTPPVSTLEPVCTAERRFGPYGVITSPNYPGNYYNDLSCYYYIYGTTGGSITLVFEDFHLDVQDDLTIECATNNDFTEQHYSGHMLPQPVLIPWCLAGSLHFSTDSSTVSSGFSIDYYLNEGDCGNTVHNESIGNVTSPKYPSNYNYNQNCSSFIWAPQRSHFHLNFLFFELQDCGLCPRDWVEISCLDNNPSDKHTFCGTSHYPVDFYQCSLVLVLFQSDGANNYQGFNLEYNVSPDSENTTVAGTTSLPQTTQTSPVSTPAPGCDAFHCGTSGTITSPNYPGLYHNSLKCNNDIYAPTESSITFIFEHFDMQNDMDYITIRCETNASFPEQRYSGHTLPPPLSIPWCSQASLYFQTDTSEVFSGFSIDYYVSGGDCGNTLYTASAGKVTSPNYPSNFSDFQNCSNIIWAPQRSQFHLNFQKIDIGSPCQYCTCDWVEMSCLDNTPSHRRRFCGGNEEILDFYQCTQVLVWFHSDGYSSVFPGFDLSYNVYPMPGCGDESHYGPSGVISSANYPDNYDDSLYCDYIIDTFSSSGSIAIIFKAFNTEECCDYVTVSCQTNSSYSPVTYSGSSLPQPVSIPWCSQGRVNLQTDISIVSPGFSLDYHVSLGGCGDTMYTGVNGIISSPNYPNNYSDNQNCSNIIWANKLTTFHISFLNMNLEECCDFVELSCLDNPAYGNHRFTGDSIPPTETIPQCTQVLVWFFSDDSNVRKGFSLEYLTTSEPDDPNILDDGKPNAAEKVPSNGKPNAADKVPSNGKPNAAEKVPSNGKPNAAEKVPSNGKPNPAEKVNSDGKPKAAQ